MVFKKRTDTMHGYALAFCVHALDRFVVAKCAEDSLSVLGVTPCVKNLLRLYEYPKRTPAVCYVIATLLLLVVVLS